MKVKSLSVTNNGGIYKVDFKLSDGNIYTIDSGKRSLAPLYELIFETGEYTLNKRGKDVELEITSETNMLMRLGCSDNKIILHFCPESNRWWNKIKF